MGRILGVIAAVAMVTVAVAQTAHQVTPGKYRCYAYTNPSMPILAETVFLEANGSYRTQAGGAKTGKYKLSTTDLTFDGGPITRATAKVEGERFRLQYAQSSGHDRKWSSLVCSPAK